MTVTVQGLYEQLRHVLLLQPMVEPAVGNRPVAAADVHRPGMALMGFAENFLPGRVQVLGESEMAFLATLDAAGQRTAAARVLDLEPPVVFVAMDLDVPGPVVQVMRERGIPLIRSALPAVEFMAELTHNLERAFAPRTELHGTLVDVYGVGLLFTGRSGIGKSECALDLIERGHRLVADDIVEITRTGDDVLIGRYRDVLRHHLEIRGVGVIDVQAIFGIRAIRMQKRIEVEVQLQDWDDGVDYERIGLENRYTEVLGVSIPQVAVPLYPGKNITVISEVIALNFMLKIYGYDAAEVLNERILSTMRSSDRLRKYLEQDRE
ncbi:MAG TPA: HPr(Ser) kinase/phosphatase [Candidatus Krumholzibacteria bacterium]|nr:HPr(Ser) kinase/phosphatase [Candidatus Krumholzibacteria bacterium]